MDLNSLSGLNIIIYSDSVAVDMCVMDYMGLLSVRLKGCNEKYLVGTHLELEIQQHQKINIEKYRFAAAVSSCSGNYVELCPCSMDDKYISIWRSVLYQLLSS